MPDGTRYPKHNKNMARLDLRKKLSILAAAARYDPSCASSGGGARTSAGGKGNGSAEGMGICHACMPDARCSRCSPGPGLPLPMSTAQKFGRAHQARATGKRRLQSSPDADEVEACGHGLSNQRRLSLLR